MVVWLEQTVLHSKHTQPRGVLATWSAIRVFSSCVLVATGRGPSAKRKEERGAENQLGQVQTNQSNHSRIYPTIEHY